MLQRFPGSCTDWSRPGILQALSFLYSLEPVPVCRRPSLQALPGIPCPDLSRNGPAPVILIKRTGPPIYHGPRTRARPYTRDPYTRDLIRARPDLIRAILDACPRNLIRARGYTRACMIPAASRLHAVRIPSARPVGSSCGTCSRSPWKLYVSC